VRLVIVDNYDSFTFNLVQMFGEIAGERPIVVKNDEVGPREIMALNPSGVALSPGPGHPRDAGRLIEIIRDIDPEMPIFGVCLGHQAIVEAEGGRVVGAGVIMHGKTSDVEHDGGVCFSGVTNPFVAMRYHSLAAERASLPSTLRENARTADGTIMAVEHKTRPVFGVQFHPESLATGIGAKILANFVQFCAERSAVASRRTVGMEEEGIGRSLERLLARSDLSRDLMRSLGERLLAGSLSQAQIGALAMALRAKGEHADELAGLALALRGGRTTVAPTRKFVEFASAARLRSTVFDVASAAALVVAGAGVGAARMMNVATPGLLDALGIPTGASPELAARLIDELGVAFLPPALSALPNIPTVHEIGERTIFDLVGPLVCPAGGRRHVIGVLADQSREVVVRSLKTVGAERALVVHGEDGLDVLSTVAPTRATELHEDGTLVERLIDARDLGLAAPRREELRAHSAARDAEALLEVLHGQRGPHRDIVALNAAVGLVVSGIVPALEAGLVMAFEAIDSGGARSVLDKLRAFKTEEVT
jgi:anthranilate synthase/phosphoribosyltransferase